MIKFKETFVATGMFCLIQVRSNFPLNDRWVWYFYHLSRKKACTKQKACTEVHAFCETGDENIMPTCREVGN